MDKINFGFINIDKPIGPTSFSVSHFLKRELNLNKTSHLGTLDPNVTGVLPIALGRACKLSSFLMRHNKTYIGILETHKANKIEDLQKIIDKDFSGEITQTPPHKSAVKRAPRNRSVYKWELLEALNDRDFLFIAEVEGGTYIRKLCSDLGELVGGAHMAELRRIQAGVFSENSMHTLYEFQDALTKYKNGDNKFLNSMIIPAEEIIKKVFPIIQVKPSCINNMKTGKKMILADLVDKKLFNSLKENDIFAIFCDEEFLEIAQKCKTRDYIARSLFVYN